MENATLCSIIEGQICKNLDGSFNCSCPDGTEVVDGRCVCRLSVIATCLVRIAVVLWLVSNECTSSPCQNGAACIDGVGVFSCRCSCGFTGVLCESGKWMIDFLFLPMNESVCWTVNVDIDECASNPCERNGTCVDERDDFECICPPGFKGKTCNIGTVLSFGLHRVVYQVDESIYCNLTLDIDECLSEPCFNDATCVDGRNGFMCHCMPGYTGFLCQSMGKLLTNFAI